MFYAPTLPTDLAPLTKDEVEGFAEVYSDFHKDAIGCRSMSCSTSDPVEAAKEQERLTQWMREGERIDVIAAEVGRFRFSQRMEYIMRSRNFGGPSEVEAFKLAIQEFKRRPYPRDELPTWEECLEEAAHYGWEFLALDCNLAQSDGAVLKAWWEAHS